MLGSANYIVKRSYCHIITMPSKEARGLDEDKSHAGL